MTVRRHSVLDEIDKGMDDLDDPVKPLNERQKLSKEVKEMLERSGKKIKTLKEHKEEVKKKKESQISDAVNRREAEERRDRAQAERVVKKWEKNYTSEESDIKEEGLNVCYCICGQYSMILDVSLDKLPKRKSDGSLVVNEKKRVCKRNMVEGQTKLIRRKGGLERQYRFSCKQCGLFLCYRSVPGSQSGKYTYVVKGALTHNPGEAE
ncbi:hypothetical protein AAMO2058_000188000 [Amorphochlora amoebiformis]